MTPSASSCRDIRRPRISSSPRKSSIRRSTSPHSVTIAAQRRRARRPVRISPTCGALITVIRADTLDDCGGAGSRQPRHPYTGAGKRRSMRGCGQPDQIRCEGQRYTWPGATGQPSPYPAALTGRSFGKPPCRIGGCRLLAGCRPATASALRRTNGHHDTLVGVGVARRLLGSTEHERSTCFEGSDVVRLSPQVRQNGQSSAV